MAIQTCGVKKTYVDRSVVNKTSKKGLSAQTKPTTAINPMVVSKIIPLEISAAYTNNALLASLADRTILSKKDVAKPASCRVKATLLKLLKTMFI